MVLKLKLCSCGHIARQHYEYEGQHETDCLRCVCKKYHEREWVMLAKDQSLPECLEGNRPRAKAFRDIISAGFVKVIKEGAK